MPRNPSIRGECRGKKAYGSKQAARNALRHCRGSLAVLHCYRCSRCGAWHLGHRDERGGG